MSCTPGTPDDWTDTVEPERAEAFIEYLSIDVGYNLRHYASPHASHRMGKGCQCRPSRIPHITLAAPESARGGCMADFDAPQAPQEVPTPERPANRVPGLPRQIEPEDVRVGMVIERRKGDAAVRDRARLVNGGRIDGTVAYLWKPGHEDDGWSLWLIEDAPEPVDPDADLIDSLAKAMWDAHADAAGYSEDDPWAYGDEGIRDEWRSDAREWIAAARSQGYRIEVTR